MHLPVGHLEVANIGKWSAKTADFHKLNNLCLSRQQTRIEGVVTSEEQSWIMKIILLGRNFDTSIYLFAYLESRCIIRHVVT